MMNYDEKHKISAVQKALQSYISTIMDQQQTQYGPEWWFEKSTDEIVTKSVSSNQPAYRYNIDLHVESSLLVKMIIDRPIINRMEETYPKPFIKKLDKQIDRMFECYLTYILQVIILTGVSLQPEQEKDIAKIFNGLMEYIGNPSGIFDAIRLQINKLDEEYGSVYHKDTIWNILIRDILTLPNVVLLRYEMDDYFKLIYRILHMLNEVFKGMLHVGDDKSKT